MTVAQDNGSQNRALGSAKLTNLMLELDYSGGVGSPDTGWWTLIMQEIDYFDAVAGRIVGGAIRYALLLSLGILSTLMFLASSIATVVALRSEATSVTSVIELIPVFFILIVLAIAIVALRFFRFEPIAAIKRALAAMRSELILSGLALASVYILVFH